MSAADGRCEIMFFIPDFNGGGAERALVNLLTCWPADMRQRWQPVVVVRRRAGPLLTEMPNWVEILSLRLPRAGLMASLGTVVRLSGILRKRRPKLVVTFLSHLSVIVAIRFAALRSPVVASIQNPPSQLWNDPESRAVVRSRLTIPLQAWSYRSTDLVFALTPELAREVVKQFAIPSSRVVVLPNSVDLRKIGSLRSMPVDHIAFRDPRIPVVLTACRLTHQKGVDILLRAASLLQQDLRFHVVILGDGPQREDLEQLARRLEIHPRVFFLGFEPNPWKFISKASVFVLASRYEGFGNVLVEAMACGVPVVATRAPFGPEYIMSDGRCGICVPPDEPVALAEALWRVLSDGVRRQQLKVKGMERAEYFEAGRVFDCFWQSVRPLLNRSEL